METEMEVEKEGTTTITTQKKKRVIIVGVDESEQSKYALEWTLDRFFVPFAPNYPFDLIILHARPSTASVIGGFAGPETYVHDTCWGGAAAPMIYPLVDADLKRMAKEVLETAKQICRSRWVEAGSFVQIVGDAREVLVDAVDKHGASMLVVGSHGHGFLKRAFLGSVSDHCAHHACCCVLIVKPPSSMDKH